MIKSRSARHVESKPPRLTPERREDDALSRVASVAESPFAGCVLGFGDILCGDRALGCAVIDALLQECLGQSVTLAYCGADLRGIEAWMHNARVVHVVIGVCMGWPVGSALSFDWAGTSRICSANGDLEVFRQPFGEALARLDMIGASPSRVMLHLGQTTCESGFGMSPEALRAARTTAWRIRRDLVKTGLAPGPVGRENRLYHSVLLDRMY
jgi:Ni,Fe-hydrogenase maturation factor